ncbi:hypothetical protein ACWJJH_16785 [Endozoicomonadaceae bacterium StTr2]
MGICADELRRYVVRPTLRHLGQWSQAAENLLLGTAAQESGLGFHLKQANHRALGIYQISPRMHKNVWDKYLAQDPELASKIRGLASQREFLAHPHLELATNLSYATAIAWVIYLRTGHPLPAQAAEDLNLLGRYWHRHYHSHAHGTVEAFVANYHTLILEETQIQSLGQTGAHKITAWQH